MWANKPFIYEINTWVWLTSLSGRYNRSVTLSELPEEVLDELGQIGCDAIWLMGIWQRSPAGRASALNYVHEYAAVLPDVTEDDIIGSAYAIGAYEVDARLGGREGVATLRQRLQRRGLKLILDFVPNHVATDHAWISEHPDYFVRANEREFKRNPSLFFPTQDAWGRMLYIAHGRDPYFPSWIDTAQLNAFSEGYRQAALDTLLDIASQCDGVRCDMAMLILNSVFINTWGDFLDEPLPQIDFWVEIISGVKAHYPDFLFMAEVYWGLEGTLLQQGFRDTYDKTLYDRIGHGDIQKIRDHLQAPMDYQGRTVRFIENHDELRAAAAFGTEKSMAAAALVTTLPGATLLHEGQFTGRRVKLPVQIRRQPDEPPDENLSAFYHRLLAETRAEVYQSGEWQMLPLDPSSGENGTHWNLLAYGWRSGDSPAAERRVIVINLTNTRSQGIVQLAGWGKFAREDWCLHDVLDDAYYYRTGKQLNSEGLVVELKAYGAQIFRFEPVDKRRVDASRCGPEQPARSKP